MKTYELRRTLFFVVLLSENNSYCLESKSCCLSECTMYYTNRLSKIIRDNKFDYNDSNKDECDDGRMICHGKVIYIEVVKWNSFIYNIDYYIDKAYERQNDMDNYTIEMPYNNLKN